MLSPSPSSVQALNHRSKSLFAESGVTNGQLERLDTDFEFLQFFPARIEKRDCDAVSIARAWCCRNGNESEVRRRTALDVSSKIVSTSNQPSGRQNGGAQLGGKFCDVRCSSNKLHLPQLAEESNSLNIGLFALDLCSNVKPPDSSTCHFDEVLGSGSSVELRVAISTVCHPYGDADSAKCSDCLNPGRHCWFCCDFDHCLQPESDMENREKSSSCNQDQKSPVRNFERLGCHKRQERGKLGRTMIFKGLLKHGVETRR